jgi:hypothetical protein
MDKFISDCEIASTSVASTSDTHVTCNTNTVDKVNICANSTRVEDNSIGLKTDTPRSSKRSAIDMDMEDLETDILMETATAKRQKIQAELLALEKTDQESKLLARRKLKLQDAKDLAKLYAKRKDENKKELEKLIEAEHNLLENSRTFFPVPSTAIDMAQEEEAMLWHENLRLIRSTASCFTPRQTEVNLDELDAALQMVPKPLMVLCRFLARDTSNDLMQVLEARLPNMIGGLIKKVVDENVSSNKTNNNNAAAFRIERGNRARSARGPRMTRRPGITTNIRFPTPAVPVQSMMYNGHTAQPPQRMRGNMGVYGHKPPMPLPVVQINRDVRTMEQNYNSGYNFQG